MGKKVKMWKWWVRSKTGRIFTTIYHKTEEEAQSMLPDHEILERADWSEIEVEEE